MSRRTKEQIRENINRVSEDLQKIGVDEENSSRLAEGLDGLLFGGVNAFPFAEPKALSLSGWRRESHFHALLSENRVSLDLQTNIIGSRASLSVSPEDLEVVVHVSEQEGFDQHRAVYLSSKEEIDSGRVIGLGILQQRPRLLSVDNGIDEAIREMEMQF